jgi:small GTP-binding protein
MTRSATDRRSGEYKIGKLELEGKSIKLETWDHTGMWWLRTSMFYYRRSSGVVVVYDITGRESFEKVQHWVSEIDTGAPSDVCRLLLGNKADLNDERVVKTDAGVSLARQYGISFLETSAKDASNV